LRWWNLANETVSIALCSRDGGGIEIHPVVSDSVPSGVDAFDADSFQDSIVVVVVSLDL